MAVSNRAAKLAKLHKVAKKHYQPVKPPADRSVLDHLLYACCLEDSRYEAADDAFARLKQGFFDWNEVRVTTAVELAEVMDCLSEPSVAATRLKKTLHSMFESHYTFDIDSLRKENLGKAVQQIEQYKGVTPFVVSYVAQNGLGGHSIGVDKSLVNLMFTIGVIDEKEAEKGVVPGMERAVPKNKGVEFFSVIHQLAVAFAASPFNNDIRAILLSIDADARERFPKRVRKKKAAAKKPATKKVAKKKAAPAKKSAAATATKSAKKKKAAARSRPAAKKTPARKAAKKTVAKKKASTTRAKTKAKTGKKATRSTSRQLKKKKPR